MPSTTHTKSPIRAYSSANGQPIRQALTVSSADRFGPSATSSFRPGFPSTRNESWSSGWSSAVAQACNLPREEVPLPSGKTVSTRWVLAFFSEYPLEQAALDDLMAFENPMVLEGHEMTLLLKNRDADPLAATHRAQRRARNDHDKT